MRPIWIKLGTALELIGLLNPRPLIGKLKFELILAIIINHFRGGTWVLFGDRSIHVSESSYTDCRGQVFFNQSLSLV